MFLVQFLVLRTPEYAIVKTEHIESRHCCYNCHNPTHYRTECKAACKNLVFREETREGRYTGNRKTCDKECYMRKRHILSHTAHGRHLVAMHCVNYRTGAEEQQGFEHCVGEQVEH